MINKNKSQQKDLEEIAKQYNQNETDLNNTYAEVADENNYLTEKQIKELIQESKLEMYPVGSIYISTSEQNPSEYIGGKWESYAQGRTLIGVGTGTDEKNVQKAFNINATGGEYQHTLTANEMPSHKHTLSGRSFWTWASSNPATGLEPTGGKTRWAAATITSDATGGSQAHNNIQPYIATYMWKRVS